MKSTVIWRGPVSITGRMTIHDTIDHKHNVECGEKDPMRWPIHTSSFHWLWNSSYARFTYWLSLIRYSQHNEGWRQGTGALSEDSTEGLSFKPCITLRAVCWFPLSLIPATPGPHTLHPATHSTQTARMREIITNGTDYVLCTKCQEHFVMKKKKDWKPPNKRVLTTKMEAVMFMNLKKRKKTELCRKKHLKPLETKLASSTVVVTV